MSGTGRHDFEPREGVNKLHEKVDALLAAQHDLALGIAQIDERCKGCSATLSKHDVTLYGNGQQGVTGKLDACREKVDVCFEQLDQHKAAEAVDRPDQLSVKSACTIIGAVAGVVTTICAAIGILVFKIMEG